MQTFIFLLETHACNPNTEDQAQTSPTSPKVKTTLFVIQECSIVRSATRTMVKAPSELEKEKRRERAGQEAMLVRLDTWADRSRNSNIETAISNQPPCEVIQHT